MRNANKTFQTKNNEALSVHLYLISQGLQLNDEEEIAQNKSYKNAYNYKQFKVAMCEARNSQWGLCVEVWERSPKRLKILHFFSKIT